MITGIKSFSEYMNALSKLQADAEVAVTRERWLRVGLDLSDEQMGKANELVIIANDSGYPGQFLSAFESLVRKPVFLPCTCWWCRLKRKWQAFCHG